jgi:hypothetical protein
MGDTWPVFRKDQSFPANPHTQGVFAASNSALWVTAALWSSAAFDPYLPNPYLAWVTGGTNGAMVYSKRTWGQHEGGSHQLVPLGHKTESSGAFSLCFRPDMHKDYIGAVSSIGVVVGGDYLRPDDNTNAAAISLDTGRTWTAAITQPDGYRSSVAYDAKTKTWITVGPNGTDISRDDGRNWTALKPTTQDQPDADKNWNALSLPFVVGPKGRIGKLNAKALAP